MLEFYEIFHFLSDDHDNLLMEVCMCETFGSREYNRQSLYV